VDDALHKLEHALREFPGQAELTALLAYSNEIVAARQRHDAVNELAKRAKQLLQNGRPQEAQTLLNGAVQQYPDEDIFLPLLKRAIDAVSQGQALSAETETEVRVPKPAVKTLADFRTPNSAGRLGTDVRRPKRRIPVPGAVVGLALLIVVGLMVWVMSPSKANYQPQLDAGRSYFAQSEFSKAVDVLQQIPSSSPL